MLATKTLFANIADSTNPNGEKVLFYDPTTKLIQYSMNPVGAGATNNRYSATSRRTSSTVTSALPLSYLSSDTMLPGLYFIVVCFTFDRASSTSLSVRILNNSNNTSFGDLDTIDIQLTGIKYPGVISGISRLVNSNTFSFQFYRPVGTSITMFAADLACIQIAP